MRGLGDVGSRGPSACAVISDVEHRNPYMRREEYTRVTTLRRLVSLIVRFQ